MSAKKPQPLFVFEFTLWGVTVKVAAHHANAARRFLAARHAFRGAWTARSIPATNLGWDGGGEWQRRAERGDPVILKIINPPPRPHNEGDTELINGLRKENCDK